MAGMSTLKKLITLSSMLEKGATSRSTLYQPWTAILGHKVADPSLTAQAVGFGCILADPGKVEYECASIHLSVEFARQDNENGVMWEVEGLHSFCRCSIVANFSRAISGTGSHTPGHTHVTPLTTPPIITNRTVLQYNLGLWSKQWTPKIIKLLFPFAAMEKMIKNINKQ